jgi:Fe2+ transport system protein FeoA
MPTTPAGRRERFRKRGFGAMRLSELKEGQTATVVRVGGNGLLRRRIQEMGVVKGSDLYVEKYAPLKDPMEIVLKGFHISLRVEEAADIVVENVR